jgi:Co/Zn/Cd efflux system component
MSDQNSKKITMRISAVSIVCNVLLTTFKLIAGIVANSSALVADAVHSASDVLGSFIVMMGAVISHKSADASHPYGHEKLECIASILLGNILFIVGCVIGYNGISKIVSGADIAVPGSLALIAAAVSIVVKEALYWYTIIGAIFRSARLEEELPDRRGRREHPVDGVGVEGLKVRRRSWAVLNEPLKSLESSSVGMTITMSRPSTVAWTWIDEPIISDTSILPVMAPGSPGLHSIMCSGRIPMVTPLAPMPADPQAARTSRPSARSPSRRS